MGSVVHVRCPKCAGPVGVTGIDRIVTCGWCGVRSLVEGLPFVPELMVRPGVDRDGARRALQSLLSGPPLGRGTLRRSRFGSADLFFVPYHEVSASRVGTMVLNAAPRSGAAGHRVGEAPRPDTRVVFGGIHRVSPAVSLPGWALEQAALAGGGDVEVRLEPMDRAFLAGQGRVLHPEADAQGIADPRDRKSFAATVEDGTEIAETRVRRVWYPVWRLRYEHHGRSHFATVDGVSGQVMGARAPQGDSGRVFWLLSAAMLVAWLLGGALRTLGEAVAGTGSPGFGLFRILLAEPTVGTLLLGTVAVAVLVAAAVAWEQFRYPGEFVFRGDSFEVEKIGAPPENAILKLASRLSDVLSRGFEGGRGGP